MLESLELLPFFVDERKVFTAKVKANIANFWLCAEFSATIGDPVASEKWKVIYFVGKPNGNRKTVV